MNTANDSPVACRHRAICRDTNVLHKIVVLFGRAGTAIANGIIGERAGRAGSVETRYDNAGNRYNQRKGEAKYDLAVGVGGILGRVVLRLPSSAQSNLRIDMNAQTHAAMTPQELAADMVPKLTQFSLAFLAGWIVAVILFHVIMWIHGSTVQHAAEANAALKDFFENLRRLL
jgi:hypothetical protein